MSARTDIDQVPTGHFQLTKADDEGFVVYTPEDARNRGRDIVARWNEMFAFTG